MAEQLTESHKEALRDLNEKKSQLNAELVSLGLLKLSIEKREKRVSPSSSLNPNSRNPPATTRAPRRRFLRELNELPRQQSPQPPRTLGTSPLRLLEKKNDDLKLVSLSLLTSGTPKATFVD